MNNSYGVKTSKKDYGIVSARCCGTCLHCHNEILMKKSMGQTFVTGLGPNKCMKHKVEVVDTDVCNDYYGGYGEWAGEDIIVDNIESNQ